MADHTPNPNDNPNDDTRDMGPDPREIARALAASTAYAEDDVLDMLRYIGDTFGWTPQLNAAGLHYLKPNAPKGEEKWA